MITTTQRLIRPPSYPARPINGGRFELAPKKLGDWFYEPKYNGWRVLVHPPTGTCYNRHGEPLSISEEFKVALAKLRYLPFPAWLDCEGLERRHGIGRGTLVVFDVLVENMAYRDRKSFINAYLPILSHVEYCEPNQVYSTPTFQDYGNGELERVWQALQDQNVYCGAEFYEGFVAKKVRSLYPMQLDNPERKCLDWMKHRFVN